jgi:hypothetical protein
MSAKFRERCSNTLRLINQMDEYEKNHPDEWCPISDQVLKDTYPGECNSQEGRDRKVVAMSDEEFETIFDATLQQYRKVRKKKGKSQEAEGQQGQLGQEQEQEMIVNK